MSLPIAPLLDAIERMADALERAARHLGSIAALGDADLGVVLPHRFGLERDSQSPDGALAQDCWLDAVADLMRRYQSLLPQWAPLASGLARASADAACTAGRLGTVTLAWTSREGPCLARMADVLDGVVRGSRLPGDAVADLGDTAAAMQASAATLCLQCGPLGLPELASLIETLRRLDRLGGTLAVERGRLHALEATGPAGAGSAPALHAAPVARLCRQMRALATLAEEAHAAGDLIGALQQRAMAIAEAAARFARALAAEGVDGTAGGPSKRDAAAALIRIRAIQARLRQRESGACDATEHPRDGAVAAAQI